ncbi:MAG: methylenetetrahydrofolate reductase, partial [Streptococcus salivarius]|nr:methylenetetrahydrofolate reductase [Streptococcus salivarius]
MTSQTPSLSFEVFPPNPAVGNEKILRALEDMQGLAPHFISVTASNNKYNI